MEEVNDTPVNSNVSVSFCGKTCQEVFNFKNLFLILLVAFTMYNSLYDHAIRVPEVYKVGSGS